MKKSMREPVLKALTEHIHRGLVGGWCVRFTWATCTAELIKDSAVVPIDGRSYHAFLYTLATSGLLIRKETGSTETKDLVIKWVVQRLPTGAESMIIKVTASDILNGRRKTVFMCPVALAIRRQTEAAYVAVSDQIGIGETSMAAKSYRFTEKLQQFINNFDEGRKVKPTSFRLYRA